MAATLKGSNNAVVYDGKKTLTITGSYNKPINLATLTAAEFDTDLTSGTGKAKVSYVGTATAKEFTNTKVSIVDATKATAAISINGGTKSTTISLGGGGGTVSGGAAADKFFGSSKSDVFVFDTKGGNDVIGDGKSNTTGYGKGDTIVISGAKESDITSFTDNTKNNGSTVILVGKQKLTVNKNELNTPLTIQLDDGSITYGTDGTNNELSTDGKTLTIKKTSAGEVVEAADLASGAKFIDATASTNKAAYIIGNGQANNISISSAGGTIHGGYDYVKKKATTDNLYGTTTAGKAVTFVYDSLAGSDNIYNYKDDDTIAISGDEPVIDTKNVKDGGAGKDVVFTTKNKNKISVKSNNASVITFATLNADGTVGDVIGQYGVDLGTKASLDSKKTTLYALTGGKKAESVESYGIDGWDHDGTWYGNEENASLYTAMSVYAPKLNQIDASNATGYVDLYSGANGSILKGGKGVTNFYGTEAKVDQFYGGDGVDVFHVSKTGGKDVIDKYTGAQDIIMIDDDLYTSVIAGEDDYVMPASLSVELSSSGVLSFYTDAKSTAGKANTVTIKNFKKETSVDKPVVVVDSEGIILAVNSKDGAPAPIGMNATTKAGLVTDANFTGNYADGSYVKGASVSAETGKSNYAGTKDRNSAEIDAADYGGAVKAINASLISGDLTSLTIKGNAEVKNTIYVPVRTKDTKNSKNKEAEALFVYVYGGDKNDNFIGNTTDTKTTVYYHMADKASGKDVIEGYNEGDVIYLPNNASLATASTEEDGESVATEYVDDKKITEKGNDVIYTNGKYSLTIKNAVGKNITFASTVEGEEGEPAESNYYYGHTLPAGLEYDSKKTNLYATEDANSTVNNEFAHKSTGNTVTYSGIRINLTDTGANPEPALDAERSAANLYTTIKTVSLSAYNGYTEIIGNTLANELYAGKESSWLYGGDPPKSKADADKLYGNVGSDTFVYKVGGGADIIGDKKKANSTLEAHDNVIIASNNASVLTRDDITITDKKEVVTITFNNDKASKLTINKASAATPINISLTDSLMGLEDTEADSDENGNTQNEPFEFVYGVDTNKFQADASNIGSGSLIITGGGLQFDEDGKVTGSETTTLMNEAGDNETFKYAEVNVNNVYSALKNINVTAASDTRVNIVGGVSALNISLGAGGGTVEGGYQVTNGKTKTFNDKFYASADAKRGTTFIIENSTGGKDTVYNYDASRGDILWFKDGAPNSVKFSAKSIVFSYTSGNKSTLTVSAPSGTSFTSATNIAIKCGEDGEVKTYFGWDAKITDFSKYGDSVRDEMWTKPADETFVFTGNSRTYVPKYDENGDTVDTDGKGVADTEQLNLYGANYTVSGGNVVDADKNYIPDGVVIESDTGVISFDTSTYIDPNVDHFHIKGQPVSKTALKEGDTISVNGNEYKLANADGNSVNGFELSMNGWVKTGDNSVVYYGEKDNKLDTGTAAAPNKAAFTLTGAISDSGSITSVVNDDGETTVNNVFLNNFTYDATDSSNPSISITASSETAMTGAHLKLYTPAKSTEDGATYSYDKYKIAVTDIDPTNEDLGLEVGTPTVATYKLYDKDGDASNGYEFLRTDISEEAHWTLVTGSDSTASLKQAKGTGVWQFESDLTLAEDLVQSKLKFSISSDAGITAADNGLPVGVSVNADSDAGMTIVIADDKFNPKDLIFDASNTFGSETKAVHISGVTVGTTFTVDSGNASQTYITAELDDNTANGFELLKTEGTSGWTFNAGAWTFDSTKLLAKKNSEDVAPSVIFTISKDASLKPDENGLPIGVTIESDTNGRVTLIDFSGMTSIEVADLAEGETGPFSRSDTSLISFASLPTGDISNTIHIKGFDSDTVVGEGEDAKVVQTTIQLNGQTYYLVDLDGKIDETDGNGYELLKKNDHWVRTADGWKFFTNSANVAVDGYADLQIVAEQEQSNGTVHAAEDGSPRGIKVSDDGKFITIASGLGTISAKYASVVGGTVAGADTLASAAVTLNEAQLHFGTTTSVNAIDGVHIFGYTTDTTIAVDRASTAEDSEELATETFTYKLANLDRDSTNGWELLPTVAGWTYNNGFKADGKAETAASLAAGSWTFDSNANVGTLTSGFTFAIDASASLLAQNDTLGSPSGVNVAVGTAEAPGATITASGNVTSTQFIFSKDMATDTFTSSTGVHFVNAEGTSGFDADNTIVAGAGSRDSVTYLFKDLDNNKENGFELLKKDANWTLTTADSGETADARSWTYNNSTLGVGLSISSAANMNAVATGSTLDGGPMGVTVQAGDKTTDPATLYFDSDTTEVTEKNGTKLSTDDFTIITSKVGASGIHIFGFDSDATVKVATSEGADPEIYRLADLDNSTVDDLELVKANSNWKFYANNVVEGSSTVHAAGSWYYQYVTESEDPQTLLTINLDSNAGFEKYASNAVVPKIVPATSNGEPEGITVEADSGIHTITVDPNKLNIRNFTSTTKYETNNFSHITLGSTTKIGKNGIHIIGFASDTAITIGDKQYYLADLDEDTSDGYELTPYNPNWHRTASGWSYVDSYTDKVNLAFTVNETIDPVEQTSESVGKSLIGAPQGFVFGVNDGESDALTVAADIDASNLTFTTLRAGEAGLHINGGDLAMDDNFTVGSGTSKKVYALKELDGDAANGFEFLRTDTAAGWSLNNVTVTGDESSSLVGREWTYENSTLKFTVNSSIDKGLHVADSDTGMPLGATVTATPTTGKPTSFAIAFGESDTMNEAAAVALGQVQFDEVVAESAANLEKIHISGLKDFDTLAYDTDTASMFTIGSGRDSATYYLADLATGTAASVAGYELIKNHANWHRYETGWSYTDTTLAFRIDSDTKAIGGTAAASILPDANVLDGTPVGITVGTGNVINISGSLAIANAIVFDSDTATIGNNGIAQNLYNIHITTDGKANESVTSFRFGKFGAYGEDGDFTSITDSDTTYYLAEVDGNTDNGKELVKSNDNWIRKDNGWLYHAESDNNKSFSFFIASTAPTIDADGAPIGITVDSDARTIKIASTSGIDDLNSLILFKDNVIGINNEDEDWANKSTHVSIEAQTNEGASVKWINYASNTTVALSGDNVQYLSGTKYANVASTSLKSYQLYNADGESDNGLELTFNGWLDTDTGLKYSSNTSIKGYRFQSGINSAADNAKNVSFILTGNAFSKATVSSASPERKDITADSTTITLPAAITDFTTANFHVMGSSTTKYGSFVEGSSVYAEAVKTTFTLKDVDGSDSTLELTNNGWAKQQKGIHIYTDSDVTFKLSSTGTTSNPPDLDANNNLIPEVVENNFQKSGDKLHINFQSRNAANGKVFTFAEAKDSDSVVVFIEDVHYGLTSNTSNAETSILEYIVGQESDATVTYTTSSQLPSDDWALTGYDIDTLLSYENGAITSDELESILEIKPLAATDSAFDAGDLFTGVAKDKSVSDLTYAARHKDRK